MKNSRRDSVIHLYVAEKFFYAQVVAGIAVAVVAFLFVEPAFSQEEPAEPAIDSSLDVDSEVVNDTLKEESPLYFSEMMSSSGEFAPSRTVLDKRSLISFPAIS